MNIYHPPNPALLIAIPLLTALVLPVVGWWKKALAFPMALIALALTAFTSLRLVQEVVQSGTVHYYMGGWEPPWGIALRIDHLGVMMAVLVSVIAFVVTIYAKRSI